jgi:hypothetical protein
VKQSVYPIRLPFFSEAVGLTIKCQLVSVSADSALSPQGIDDMIYV